MKIIEEALKQGRTILSEYESKQVLTDYQIPITHELLVNNMEDFMLATAKIGYPLVIKGCAPDIAHKTEQKLIRVDIRNDQEAKIAFSEIVSRMDGKADKNSVLVQEFVEGSRELVAGLKRDPQFGVCVLFGLGGILTEILEDVAIRKAPLEKQDALEMMREIKGHKILEPIRGMEAPDLNLLADILINVGRVGLENHEIKEIDINPIIITQRKFIAVDALVILHEA